MAAQSLADRRGSAPPEAQLPLGPGSSSASQCSGERPIGGAKGRFGYVDSWFALARPIPALECESLNITTSRPRKSALARVARHRQGRRNKRAATGRDRGEAPMTVQESFRTRAPPHHELFQRCRPYSACEHLPRTVTATEPRSPSPDEWTDRAKGVAMSPILRHHRRRARRMVLASAES